MRKSLNIYSKEEELKISILMDLSEYKRGHCALLHLLDKKDSVRLTKIDFAAYDFVLHFFLELELEHLNLQCRFTILSKN